MVVNFCAENGQFKAGRVKTIRKFSDTEEILSRAYISYCVSNIFQRTTAVGCLNVRAPEIHGVPEWLDGLSALCRRVLGEAWFSLR